MFFSESPPRVKPLLYTFRVLLTGIHLMRSGQLNANLEELNGEFNGQRVDELIQLKRTTKEKITLSDGEFEFFQSEFERLIQMLGEAERDSILRAEPDNRADFDALLRRLRRST